MAQKLPPQLPERLNHSSKLAVIQSAYSKILQLEQVTQAAVDANPNLQTAALKLIHARVLGYLIREGPSMQASEHVAQDVDACQDNDKMDELGKMYQLHLIRLFRKNKGATPSPSTHPSRPSFETKREMVTDMLRESGEVPQRHDRAKKKALVRDNFRCIVTGKYDDASVDKNRELEEEVVKFRAPTCHTQCAHIFPQSTNMGISGSKEGDVKLQYAGTVWAILECFGYKDLPDRLCGDGIHSLDNVMTLEYDIHAWFDELKLWFEAVDDKENTYNICVTKERILGQFQVNPIEFTSADPDLPLPNPTYLKIHAACCRVAHLSGAGEYMDKVLEDVEDMGVLSKDGSSAHVLEYALQAHSQEVSVVG